MTNLSNMPVELVYDDLEPIKIPVKIKGTQYVLKEADESATIKFRNFMSRNVTYGDNGVTKIENQGEAPLLLVSLCLFKVNHDRDGKEVHTPVVKTELTKWKTTLIKDLYKNARKISGMDDGEDDNVEEIDKKIEELQEKREKLISKEPKEEKEKNS